MKMIKIFQYLLAALAITTLASCDDDINPEDIDVESVFSTTGTEASMEEGSSLQVMDVRFSPDYKKFHVYTYQTRDIGPYALTDSNQVRIEAKESVSGIVEHHLADPRLIGVKNLEADMLAKMRVKMLVLVDLTLPQDVLDNVKKWVAETKAVFAYSSLYIAFMYGENVSETMEVSNYIIENYFQKTSDKNCYLYRSILVKKREMEDQVGVWADAKKMNMLIFSSEKVYGDDDAPVDPKHFELQSILINPDSLDNPKLMVSAVSLKALMPDMVEEQAESILKVLCSNTGGLYMDTFSLLSIRDHLLGLDATKIPSNEFTFLNPDWKVYRGNINNFELKIYDEDSDSLICEASMKYVLGTPYNPVIVGVEGDSLLFIQGFVLAAIVMLIVYAIMQFLVPYIRYRIFLKKYVVKYVRGNMSVENKVVKESCYYCKAMFQEGDEVVVKCEHVMHKHCWDENGYHCTEHGRRCKEGSHYYNHVNLFDPGNGLFHTKWVLWAILASFVSWVACMLYVNDFSENPNLLIANITKPIFTDSNEPYADFLREGTDVSQAMALGLFMGFFLTFAFTMLGNGRQLMTIRLRDAALRAVIAGIACYAVFSIHKYLIYAFNLGPHSDLVEWVPWTLSALVIMFISIWGTRISLTRYTIGVAILLGVVSMYIWSFLVIDYMILDFRVLMMVSCMVYGGGLAACIAHRAPRSERFFLSVKGAMKEMDIALYKWFLNNPDQVVTIGKSIDCSLQMSWDIKGQVAPVQAEISQVGSALRLTALEDGVIVNGKSLGVNNNVWLYHNMEFTIGDTTFTYVERDV